MQPGYYPPQPQYQPQQHQQQQVVVVQQPAVQPSYVVSQYAVPPGKFTTHLWRNAVKRCGDCLIVLGVFTIVGQILEQIGAGIYYGSLYGVYCNGQSHSSEYGYGDPSRLCTSTAYAGYWCGIIMIVCGSIATHTFYHVTDCIIVADLVCAVVGLVFSIVVLAKAAQAMPVARLLNDYSSYAVSYVQLWLASYAIMIITGVLGMICSILLGVCVGIAVARGLGFFTQQGVTQNY